MSSHLSLAVALLALAALAAGTASEAISRQRECHTGVDFVRALLDASVGEVLLANDVVLSNDDFSESPALPIVLSRNLTVQGSSTLLKWPVLDLGSPTVSQKLRLSNGSTLMMRHIVLDNYRTGAHFQAPGLDILAPCDPGDWGLVMEMDMIMIQRACLPPALREQSLRAAPRPPNYPYLPNNTLTSDVSQAGCVNASDTTITATGSVVQRYNSSANSAVHPTDRCWPGIGLYVSVITYGFDVNFTTSKPFRTGYDLYGDNLLFYCAVQLSAACVATYSALGCFLLEVPYARLPNATAAPPPPPPLPAGMALPAAEISAAGDGGSSGSGPQLGPLLGGVLGGAALLAVLGAAALLLLRRRRRRHQAALGSKGSHLPGPEDGAAGFAIMLSTHSVARARDMSLFGLQVRAPSKVKAKGCRVVDDDAAGTTEEAGCTTSALSMTATTETPLRSASAAVGSGPSPGRGGGAGGGDSGGGTAEGRALLALLGACSEVAVPVTPCMPPRPEVVMGVRVTAATRMAPRAAAVAEAGGALEVKLLPVVRGKGTYGKVVEGMYCGERVAVKLISETAISMSAGDASECMTALSINGQEGGSSSCGVGNGPAGGPTGTNTDSTGASGGVAVQFNWQQASFAQEVEVLARCQHPNIVRLLAANVRPPRVCLVMELMETSLEHMVHGPKLLPLRTVLHIATGIAQGLSYLHPTIVHRDLKPANVLINGAGTDRPIVKLTDFGLSRLRATVGQTENPEVGTPAYMGPEIFDMANTTVTDKADMWALGVVLWEMLTGMVPWSGLGLIDIACRITIHEARLPTAGLAEEAAGGGGARCPPRLLALLQQCWEQDPQRRPAAAEVVKELTLIALSLEEDEHEQWRRQQQQRPQQQQPPGAADPDVSRGAEEARNGGIDNSSLPEASTNYSLVVL